MGTAWGRLLICALLGAPMAVQAALLQFNAQLTGAAERPNPTPSEASGLATLLYDDLTDTYDFSLFASELSGSVSGAHIHGQADADQSAGVRVDLQGSAFVVSAAPGLILIGGADVAAPASVPAGNGYPAQSFLAMLRQGLAYINIHTTPSYPGGEIRGQLIEVTPVPEPVTWMLMLAGLGALAVLPRARARTA